MPEPDAVVIAAGTLTAAVTGYLAMRFMLKKLTRKGMLICAVYAACLGAFLVADKAWLHWVF